jgi:transposase
MIEIFVVGATARAAAEILGVNRNTVRIFYHQLACSIAGELLNYELSGEVEPDESYFGGVRKGKRERGAAGKIAVFWLLKRGGKVYAATILNAKTETLKPIIKERVQPDSMVYTDSFGIKCIERERLSS